TAHRQCSLGGRGGLLSMCHGNGDVIVQVDRHHKGIKEVVTVWPSADDAQIHVDFCRSSALHSTHTLALVIQSCGAGVSGIVSLASDEHEYSTWDAWWSVYPSPCQVSCGKMNRLAFSPDPPILWQQTVGVRWTSSHWGMALGKPHSCTGCTPI